MLIAIASERTAPTVTTSGRSPSSSGSSRSRAARFLSSERLTPSDSAAAASSVAEDPSASPSTSASG